MGRKGPGPFLEIQVPLKNNNSPPPKKKFQISSAPRKYTTSKISSSFLISGGFIPC